MKSTFASIVIVIFLALVLSLAVPASANLAGSSKSTTQTREDQIIGVNITPINVEANGTITATGYVQGYCGNCNPPQWQPAAGVEVHFDRVDSDNNWWIDAKGTTDSNGYFSLTCQAQAAAGNYQYGILVPQRGSEGGAQVGPWWVIVH
jgi:hypothetical protein